GHVTRFRIDRKLETRRQSDHRRPECTLIILGIRLFAGCNAPESIPECGPIAYEKVSYTVLFRAGLGFFRRWLRFRLSLSVITFRWSRRRPSDKIVADIGHVDWHQQLVSRI